MKFILSLIPTRTIFYVHNIIRMNGTLAARTGQINLFGLLVLYLPQSPHIILYIYIQVLSICHAVHLLTSQLTIEIQMPVLNWIGLWEGCELENKDCAWLWWMISHFLVTLAYTKLKWIVAAAFWKHLPKTKILGFQLNFIQSHNLNAKVLYNK